MSEASEHGAVAVATSETATKASNAKTPTQIRPQREKKVNPKYDEEEAEIRDILRRKNEVAKSLEKLLEIIKRLMGAGNYDEVLNLFS